MLSELSTMTGICSFLLKESLRESLCYCIVFSKIDMDPVFLPKESVCVCVSCCILYLQAKKLSQTLYFMNEVWISCLILFLKRIILVQFV